MTDDWGIAINGDSSTAIHPRDASSNLTLVYSSVDLLEEFVVHFELPEREEVSVSVAKLNEFIQTLDEGTSGSDDYYYQEGLIKIKEFLGSSSCEAFWIYAWW